MYFNEKSDTDINKDISKSKNKKKKNNILKNNKAYFIIGIFIIIFIISLILIFTNSTEYYLELSGEEYIKIYEGSEYIEDANGYYAYDSNGNNLTNEVIIDSDLDTNTVGEYTITYSIMDISKERYISVIEKPNIATYIHLKGDDVVYLSINEEYDEPGYTAIDTFDSNLTKKVKVTNNIDTSKAGIYKVTYSVTNSSGVTSSAVRKVIVMDSEVSLSLSNTNPTNSDVSINIHITDNYYSYLILPNNNKITSKDYSYKINSNGEYKFTIYNTKGKSVTKSISVTNIDKEAPTGSCSGYIQGDKSYITVDATDNLGISKYTVAGINSTSNIITLDSAVTTQTVTIYDKAGNSKEITCTLEKKNIQPKIYDDTFINYISTKKGKYFKIDDELRKILDDDSIKGYLFIPKDLDYTKTYSFITKLGGLGDMYESSVNKYSIGKLLSSGYAEMNSIIFNPYDWANISKYDTKTPMTNKWISELVDRLPVDYNKISLVGTSRGGYKALALVNDKPNYYSVAVIEGASTLSNCSIEICSIETIATSKDTIFIYAVAVNDNLSGTWNYKYSTQEYEYFKSNGNKVLLYKISGGSHSASTSFESYELYEDLMNIDKSKNYTLPTSPIEVSLESITSNNIAKDTNNNASFNEYYYIYKH